MPLTDTDNVNIHIKTTSDNTGTKDSEKALHDLGDKAGKVAKDIGIAMLAIGGAAVAFGVSSVKAFSESQDVLAQTNATIKSTGGIAGVTADEVQKLASAFQKSTPYSDEQTRSGENLLLTFTNIGQNIFPRATQAMLDMSTTMHQDVNQSAVQLGKALQSPIQGMAALSKTGALNRDDMTKLKDKWEKDGTPVYQQQIDLLQALEKEFKGSSEAAGGTFSGSLAKLKNSFNDVQESIGETLVKGLTPLAQKMSDFVASDKFQQWLKEATAWLNDNIPKAIKYVSEVIIPALKEAFDMTWPVIKDVIKWAGDLVSFLLDNQWVFWAIVGVFGAIRTAMFLQDALLVFQGVMTGAATAFGGLQALIAIPMVMPAIAVGAALLALWSVKDAAVDAWNAVNDAKRAAASMESSNTIVRANLQALAKNGTPEQQARAKLQLANGVGLAGGSDFTQEGVTLVGEQGPELVYMPRGATVKTAGQTKDIMSGNGGGGTTVNYNAPIYLTTTDAVKQFFSMQDKNSVLATKGLSPVRM